MNDMYRVIARDELIIFKDYSIPTPYSDALPSKQAALEWIAARGLRAEVKVITESLYQQNSKVIPEGLGDDDIHTAYAIYKARRGVARCQK